MTEAKARSKRKSAKGPLADAAERAVVIDLRSFQRATGGLTVAERQLLALVANLRNGGAGRPRVVGYRSPLLPMPGRAITDLCDRIVTSPHTGLDRGMLLCADMGSFLPALARTRDGGRLHIAAIVDGRARLPPDPRRAGPVDTLLVLGAAAAALQTQWPMAEIVELAWRDPFFPADAPADPIETLALQQLVREDDPIVVLAPEMAERHLRAVAVARAEAARRQGRAPRLLLLQSRSAPPRLPPLAFGMTRSMVQFGDILEVPALSEGAAASLFRHAAAVLLLSDAPYPEYGAREVAKAGGRAIPLSSAQILGQAPNGDGRDPITRLMEDALSGSVVTTATPAAGTDDSAALPWRTWTSARIACGPDNGKRALALVAPYPTSEFGVSIYTRDTGNAVSKLVDLDLFTEKPVLPRDRFGLRSVHPPDRLTDPLLYREVVHVVYNHKDAIPAYDSLLKNGGAVVLHDAQVLDLLNSVMEQRELKSLMTRALGRCFSEDEFDKWFISKRDLPDSFLGTLLEKATTLIVHSPTAHKYLSENFGVRCVYVPVAIQHRIAASQIQPGQTREAKLRCGMDPSRISLGTFGAVQTVKGDKELLYVAKDLLDWGHDIDFYYVGQVLPERREHLEAVAARIDVADRVRFAADVSEQDYITHLIAMDAAVQLRVVGMGQLSGALLDCVAASLPTVATEGLAASIDAPDFVRTIDDVFSPLRVADAVSQMLHELPDIPRPHPQWTAYVEDHSFERYAQRLVDAL